MRRSTQRAIEIPKSATKWRLLQSAALIEDFPGVAHFKLFHFSAVTLTLPPHVLPPPCFWVHLGLPGQRRFYPRDPADASSAESRLCPRGFRRRQPTSDRPLLSPAWAPGVARAPWGREHRASQVHSSETQLGVALDPKVALRPDLKILAARHPSSALPPGQAPFPGRWSSTAGPSPIGLSSHRPRSAALGNLRWRFYILLI